MIEARCAVEVSTFTEEIVKGLLLSPKYEMREVFLGIFNALDSNVTTRLMEEYGIDGKESEALLNSIGYALKTLMEETR